MKYILSNRQVKELGNGKVMGIALPYPDAGIPGAHRHHDSTGDTPAPALAAWFRSRLDAQGADYHILSIAIIECAVDPATRPAGGLSALYGTLLAGDGRRGPTTIRVVCVVAHISRDARPARSIYPSQWPGKLIADNLTLA